MCGRFFWDNDAEEAFEDDFPELARIARAQEKILRAGDYMPSMNALAVVGRQALDASTAESLAAEYIKWGFHGFDKGKLLINARAEGVRSRPTFADSFAARRCVLPAAGFYEWDKKKEKVTFKLQDRPILYLAGMYRPYGEEKRFVVLTREANDSMRPVHDRMPLILTREEVSPWVMDVDAAGSLLAKELPMLSVMRPYEQMTFEW